MATCDDDFGLLDDDAHPPPETQPGPSPPGFYLPQKRPLSSPCFADDDAASHFSPAAWGETQAPDRKRHHQAAKRRGGAEEESGDGGDYCSCFSNGGGQRSKMGRGGDGSASSAADVEWRRDREEWSDEAIRSLLDAYRERFEQLKLVNLRCRDWEDVADAVTKQHKAAGGWGKSVEQCKNKVDNLKSGTRWSASALPAAAAEPPAIGPGSSSWSS